MKLEWRNLYTICILFITAIFISLFVNSASCKYKYVYRKNINT